MRLAKLFERKRPHIRVQLNDDGTAYIVPVSWIQNVVDEATGCEHPDQLKCSIVMMRPSDVSELGEFHGF